MRTLIFSAERSDCSLRENMQRTEELADALTRASIKYKTVVGTFKNQEEISFVVDGTWQNIVNDLCNIYNQDCYLLIENDSCYFVNEDGEKYVGQWRGQPNKPLGDYTYDVLTKTYYVIK